MAVRQCAECEWCKTLRDSDGDFIYFCLDTNGGNYCGITGICGWCGDDEEEAE